MHAFRRDCHVQPSNPVTIIAVICDVYDIQSTSSSFRKLEIHTLYEMDMLQEHATSLPEPSRSELDERMFIDTLNSAEDYQVMQTELLAQLRKVWISMI